MDAVAGRLLRGPDQGREVAAVLRAAAHVAGHQGGQRHGLLPPLRVVLRRQLRVGQHLLHQCGREAQLLGRQRAHALGDREEPEDDRGHRPGEPDDREGAPRLDGQLVPHAVGAFCAAGVHREPQRVAVPVHKGHGENTEQSVEEVHGDGIHGVVDLRLLQDVAAHRVDDQACDEAEDDGRGLIAHQTWRCDRDESREKAVAHHCDVQLLLPRDAVERGA
mmetsp:Transcript_23170/g.59105  ORF Transcript_23170/g.59105 Transcript_23170/m.59105 type:complete len:220 (+) Transcript_23170:1217-1876(+)